LITLAAETESFQRLAAFVGDECERRLSAYLAQPRDAAEHFETENEALSGAYAYRQLFELIQNAADAILESGEPTGRIEVCLKAKQLLAANTGAPLNRDGIIALLNARSSSKRGAQIGRFGIGFKSLLKLGGNVELHSRPLGLRFDPEACRTTIRNHLGLPNDARAPGMRLAGTLDPSAPGSPLEPGGDFDWATSVVVAGISSKAIRLRIAQEIQDFPAEFLLFLPVEIDLVLQAEGGSSRHVRKRMDGNVAVIDDGISETRWRIFETSIKVNGEEALSDATHVQSRQEVPLSWAMPLEGREQAGRFWAFFPTETLTHLPGILNAPWKLNSDRTNLVRGAYNEAIMAAAAGLVARSLPLLSSEGDLGASVAAFPRQLQRQDDISAPLVTALWDRILSSPSLADANGKLRVPHELVRHPVEDWQVAQAWCDAASRKEKARHVHPDSYLGKNRISRLDSLEAEARKRAIVLHPKPALNDWVCLVASEELGAARRCLELAAQLYERSEAWGLRHIPQMAIVPAEGGGLFKPSEISIPPAGRTPPGVIVVASRIASDPACRAALVGTLGVSVLEEGDWQLALFQSWQRAAVGDTTEAWDAFWQCFSSAPEEEATGFVTGNGTNLLRFRNRAGEYSCRQVLVVTSKPDDEPLHSQLDLGFHEQHRYRLPAGTFSEYPGGWVEPAFSDKALQDYYSVVRPIAYRDILGRSQAGKPQLTMIVARGPSSSRQALMPAAWQLLMVLPQRAAARLTLHLLDILEASPACLGPVVFEHQSRSDSYPKATAPHPLYWIISRFGWIQVHDQFFPIRTIDQGWASFLSRARLARFDFLEAFFSARSRHGELGDLLPWPTAPMLHPSPQAFWASALEGLRNSPSPAGSLDGAWAAAADLGVAPSWVPSPAGPKPLRDAYITTDAAAAQGLPPGEVLLLGHVTAAAWQEAGATIVTANEGTTCFASELAPPAPLSTLFPELLSFEPLEALSNEQLASWVDGLSKTAGHVRSHPALAWSPDGILLLDQGRFSALGWAGFVPLLLQALAAKTGLHLGDAGLEAGLVGQRKREVRNAVRACTGLEGKLLAAVGGSPAPLLRGLPEATLRAIPDGTPPEKVASLALAVHGPGILRRLGPDMALGGLEPPEKWTGEAAMEFVVDLGFPREFATGLQSRRAATVAVNGPVPLPPLHDYQHGIVSDLQQLLQSSEGRRRAIISLPTGGGKTRVAGEAVVKLVLNGTTNRTALWIAQTEELCEQAVECFEELWANIGTPHETLRISRLWGGQKNPPPPEHGSPVIVIASIQTLASRFSRKDLDWLKDTGIVIIDECHHAITSSYSGLFRWLDLQIGNERARDREPPVIGLSATPWRGFSDEESERLAARFDKRWLPAAQEQLHTLLSGKGVLAARRYSPIRYDREVRMTDAEMRQFERFNELPESVSARIGNDEDRNDLIVDAILASDAQSILLFANSVAHAQHLAARLHLAGCPAAAVSGETDRLARRHFTNLFRTGGLRVICNHSVLTTGFDAPKADMVFISRPVFSPVLYMQMVGRGLRGPLNGGTPHCEIMTVEDNILAFKDQLAFHFCRRFFDGT